MKTGGLLVAKQIAYIAECSKVKLMWGCNDESVVSIAAALHLALSSRSTKFLDLDGSLDLIKDVVTGGFLIKNGMMTLTGKNGLGVQKVSWQALPHILIFLQDVQVKVRIEDDQTSIFLRGSKFKS